MQPIYQPIYPSYLILSHLILSIYTLVRTVRTQNQAISWYESIVLFICHHSHHLSIYIMSISINLWGPSAAMRRASCSLLSRLAQRCSNSGSDPGFTVKRFMTWARAAGEDSRIFQDGPGGTRFPNVDKIWQNNNTTRNAQKKTTTAYEYIYIHIIVIYVVKCLHL